MKINKIKAHFVKRHDTKYMVRKGKERRPGSIGWKGGPGPTRVDSAEAEPPPLSPTPPSMRGPNDDAPTDRWTQPPA